MSWAGNIPGQRIKMNTIGRIQICCASVVAVGAALLLTGCTTPSKANIELRKQNADLRSQIDSLKRQHEGDVASLAAAGQAHGTTVPVLPPERVDSLFTVTGLQFGRLTGADPEKPNTLEIYVVPTDAAGDVIKAAGTFSIDAFDLAAKDRDKIGHWDFSVDQAAKDWFGKAMLYTYVLDCPLSEVPQHGDITLRVTFTDALTQRSFTVQKVVKISPVAPPAAKHE